MADEIKIGINSINSFKVGAYDCQIYLGTIKLYPQSQSYDVCYAVVDDITQYSETEFEDVYDKATEKWFKLNNLNQYEEYGIYGEGRNITYYEGKLTVDDGYEYEWNGSSWVNVGEVSGSSVVEYIETPTSSPYAGIELLTSPSSQSTPMYYEVDCLVKSNQGDNSILGQKSERETVSYQFGFQAYNSPYYDYGGRRLPTFWPDIGGLNNRIKVGFGVNSGDSKVVIKNLDTSTIVASTAATPTNVTIPLLCNAKYNTNTSGDNYATSGQVRYYGIKIYDNNVLVGDYIPAKNPSTNEYTFYETISQRYCSKIGSGTIAGAETGTTEYPKYYSEKSEPLDNLTFNTLAEAQAYAEANCVYDGMKATIGTDRYYFDSSDENGWVKVTEYYIVEDVTPNQASGWTISGSSTYNPDSSYYDDFDLVTTSTSSSYKIAKVTIYGYDHFTYYLRTSGYSNYCYVVATNVDEIQTPPTGISYNSSSAITNTYYFNKSPKSDVNLSNYRRVTYNNLDKTVEHTLYVYFYGRTYSSYVGNATILIPKEQTNENWEQVTFSASSNVASTQKNLYIDNNYSTSGGTQYWYYRWMIGLPSGSHSSYTNYSAYNYCPNVTSSTFTSVAGEQRQVNFTYNDTSNKTLSFRLTDGSNVLTPSNTVYYNMTYYNSCGVSSSSSNVSFPMSVFVKVGGRFRFANSSNRHYIYGYSPNISLNYDYYVDNYQSTFDITYTKLSDEAVTITYTTYDPNDSETPAFKTDITWPYSGGTTSSTTLTSYAVPYTYPYEVSQTSDKFSADGQSYTAGQTARTINFVLYPDNREFASVAGLEAYEYPWEGMIAYVGTDRYVYQNGEWVYNPSRLPVGYTEVEYVQNTGTSYLDIAFKPNTNTRVLTEMQAVSTSDYPRLFGAGVWNAAAGINLAYQSEGGTINIHISWYGRTSWSYYTSFTFDYNKHTYDLNKNYLYRDETLVGSTSYTTSYQSTDNLGIFTYIGSGRPSSSSYWGREHFKGKMYSFKVYDNGTLVRDLVPCIKDNDNTVGAYDIVNDVFYTVPTGYTTDKLIAGQPI